MTRPIPSEPAEDRLANRITARSARPRPSGAKTLLRRLGRVDRAAYRNVAEMSTPLLDVPLRRISNFANFSKPWLLVAAVLASGKCVQH